MGFNGWIISLFLLLGTLGGVSAQASECIDRAEMAEIASHFSQFRHLADKEYCFDESPTAYLLQGLMFMRKTQFAASMPTSADELFTGRFSQNWYQYLIERVTDFEIETSCQKGVIAYVYFFSTSMYVCPMALTNNFTALDLASVFMHEARHLDGYPHVTCSRGARAGIPGACDTRISDGGSYAVTVETYAQLARYAQDLHPALKSYARASSVVYADEAFETPVHIDREPRLLVMGQDSQFHYLSLANDGTAKLSAAGRAPELGRIVMRGQHMILFPQDLNRPVRFVFANSEGDVPQQAGDIAGEYNKQTPEQRAQWVDVHIGTQWTAQVYKDRVVFACNIRSNSTQTLSTSGETPVAILYPEGYDRAARRTQLIMESGKVFDLGCSGGSPVLQASGSSYDQAFKRIHKLGSEVVGLTSEGRIYRIANGRSTPIALELGPVHEIAPNQAYTFF